MIKAGVKERGLIDSGAQTLIMIAGWPDTDAVFNRQIEYLKDRYRIVTVTIPGYAAADGEKMPAFGYDLVAVIEAIVTSVRRCMQGRVDKPILVAHDWGALLGHAITVEHPTLFQRAVYLDVGGHMEFTVVGNLILIAYQWTLLLIFLLPVMIGARLNQLVAILFLVPKASRATMHVAMNYLYLRYWTRRLSSRLPKPLAEWYAPPIPVLFLYGTQKPLLLHSARWLRYLDDTVGSRTRSFNGGHWFFTDSEFANDVNTEIGNFILSPSR